MLHFDGSDPKHDLADGGITAYSFLINALVEQNLISHETAHLAQDKAQRESHSLEDILRQTYGVSQYSIARILAQAARTQLINPVEDAPDIQSIYAYGAPNCLRNGVMPWRRIGNDMVVLTTHPDQFSRYKTHLETLFGSVRFAITTEDQLNRTIAEYFGADLVMRAENKVLLTESCRDWNSRAARHIGLTAAVCILILAYIAPTVLFVGLTGWAILTLTLTTLLKAVAAFIGWRAKIVPSANISPVRLPVISVLVPLYNETAITDHLLTRLRALDYPHELLDVCLVLEANDLTTRATLGQTILPTWMRPIIVPEGTIKTKPRALNYALDFTRGSIIGVWDAEDAPAPDQLHVVARSFASRGQDVACLQGKLDYYNASTNWLTRCFAIEYASWFRVVLPGLQKLGLVIPLGGTTLFFRRDALEKLGGWDAHNVTEDADLGVRLARHGYRTDLIDTVTEEEANGRTWPWIKQRSRWLKGYAITYGVHMRNPIKLWRDLGAWRFFGVQLLFLGTLSQFVLAPILWSFWLVPLGIPHPLSQIMPSWAFWTCSGLFIASEVIGFAAAAVGLHKARKSWLTPWALTLQFYFPLGAFAAYKGLYELATRPFYWDKTAHGVLLPKGWNKVTLPAQPPVHPVSDA